MIEHKALLDHLSTKLLYVEDEDDLRHMVAETFVQVGFDVTAVGSAEEALAALETEHFDVLITDYNLSNHTGAWLLENAAARGYLRTTPALVLTSERRPAGVDGYKLLRKPIAFTSLLATISDALGARPAPAIIKQVPAVAELELVHYITSTSQDSQKAIRNLRSALKEYEEDRFHLTIIDVASSNSDDWYAGLEADRIIVTPTLVRKKPQPKTWIIGTLNPILPVEQMLTATLGSSSR